MSLLVLELLRGGLLHDDVHTVAGFGLHRYIQEPFLEDGKLVYRDGPQVSLDAEVIPRWKHRLPNTVAPKCFPVIWDAQ